jgi:Leucine-rich repeat (LRR) protein
MRKVLSFILLIGIFSLFSAVAGLGASFNVIEYEGNAISDYSIYAIENVCILGSSKVHSGNVGVSPSWEGIQFRSESAPPPERRVLIERDVYFEHDTSIYGEQVEIHRGASVYNVYSDSLRNEGEIRGEEGLYAESAPEVILPQAPAAEPGTENITVYWGEDLVLEPGHYGEIEVRAFGTLILKGGTYHMENLELGYYKAQIIVEGPTEIIINNQFTSYIKSYIGPEQHTDISAKDVYIYVGGANGGSRYLSRFPKAVQIGRYSKIFANLFAPNGTIWMQRDVIAKGAFIAKDVFIGYGVSVTLDSARPAHILTYFTDPNLEEAVREAIDKPEGDIYTSDLETLEALNASGRDVADLTGIQDCVNLTHLVLSYNNIEDISPLASLQNLVFLNLNENAVRDVAPLAGLINLSRLYLSNNNISDETLPHLGGLTNLTTLVLDYNNIADVTPLALLEQLTCLVLNDNYIENIWPLRNLTDLTVLYLHNNEISDLTPLENLTVLRVLYLYDNNIADVSHLSGLVNLTSLILDYNLIENVSPLAGLTQLSTLYLNNNNIGNVSALSELEALTTLILNTNRISDIAPLIKLKKLSYLNLGFNNISDLTALEGMTDLSVVYLNNNNINSITALVKNSAEGGLSDGDVLYITYNPLEGENVEKDVVCLTEKGVIIFR